MKQTKPPKKMTQYITNNRNGREPEIKTKQKKKLKTKKRKRKNKPILIQRDGL